MKISLPLIVASFVAASAIAAPTMAQAASTADAAAVSAPVASKGKMLVDVGGSRLAPVTRVTADGSAQIIIDTRVVTVPASTISLVDGKLTTSLRKSEVIALR